MAKSKEEITKRRYYACACNILFTERKNFVRHRMSARKDTRSVRHKLIGIFSWYGK